MLGRAWPQEGACGHEDSSTLASLYLKLSYSSSASQMTLAMVTGKVNTFKVTRYMFIKEALASSRLHDGASESTITRV